MLVPFPARGPAPARTLEALEARRRSPHPSCDITVVKNGRTRRYWLWSDQPGHWRGEVWFDRCQHRTLHVAGVHEARRVANQFARELRALVTEGWTDGAT